jgi:hypothetical protein
MIMRSEARLETGRAAGPEDEVYVRATPTASSGGDSPNPDNAPADGPAKENTDV